MSAAEINRPTISLSACLLGHDLEPPFTQTPGCCLARQQYFKPYPDVLALRALV